MTNNSSVCPASPPFGPASCIGSASTGGYDAPDGTEVFSGGAWDFSLTTLTFGNLSGFFYPVIGGNPSQFNFQGTNSAAPGTSSDYVNGTINWTHIADTGTTTAQMEGVLTISGSGGLLATDYPVNDSVILDYTFNRLTAEISTLAGDPTATGTGGAESGSVPSVPEVSSILLLGTGLLSAGTFVRLRRRRQS